MQRTIEKLDYDDLEMALAPGIRERARYLRCPQERMTPPGGRRRASRHTRRRREDW